MPMVQCTGCNTKYNTDVETSCSICAERSAKLTAAQDLSTNEAQLGQLAIDSAPEVVAAARANPNAPAWVKGTDRDRASNPETPPDLLGKLVLSSDEQVVEAALKNPSTPQWASNRARRDRGEVIQDSTGASQAPRKVRAGPKLATTDTLPGQRIIEVLGIVYASKSHTKWKGLSQYERLLTAMEGAEAELADKARRLGGNAVVGIRVSANSATGNSSGLDVGNSDGVIVVGTAVRTVSEPSPEAQQRCPYCREFVNHRASKCRYCHEDLAEAAPAEVKGEGQSS